MSNYNLENFDLNTLQKLLAMNMSKPKKVVEEARSSQENTENLLKAFLKKQERTERNERAEKNERAERNERTESQPKTSSLKFSKNSLEETLKKMTDQKKEENGKKESHKSLDLSGFPLGEIEKQIAMLKSISVKN
jgi:hypothetical protein